MFKMSAKRYIYIILIFLPIFAFSNNYIINGYIKNKHTNKPIKDVDVYLKNLKKGAVSDENGYFIFRLDNRIDQVYVEFSHVAFETVRWQGNSSRSINVEMKETLLKLDEIVITGTRTEFTSADTPVFTEVINNSDINSSNAFTLGELMEERAGVCKMYNFDGSFDYNLLGLDSKYILILKDGQPVTGKFNDKIDLDQLSLANVEKVEILKGAGSALYGTEAMGGVINLISKKGRTAYNGEFRIKNTSFDGVSTKWIENPNSQDISYNISVPINSFRLDFTSVYQMLGGGENFTIAGKDEASKMNIDFGLSWFSQNQKHFVEAGYHYFTRVDTSDTFTSTGFLIKSNSTDIFRNEFTVKHDFNLSKNIIFAQKLNFNIYERIFQQSGLDSSFLRNANTMEKLSDYEMKVNLKLGEMNTIGGFELSDPSFKNDRVNGRTYSRSTGSIFIQNDFKYLDNHKIITGFRYDKYGESHVYSPRIAYLFEYSKNMRFRFSSGTGFRIPSFLELYIDFYNVDNGYIIKGNRFLEPEKSLGSTLNLEYLNENIRMNVLAYQNRFQNKIFSTYKDTNSVITFYEYKNIAKARFQGLELFLDYLVNKATSFKLNINLRSAINGEGDPLENVIPYSAGTRFSRNFPSYSLKIYFHSTFNYSNYNENEFSIHNFQIRKNFLESLSISAGVENIGNYTNIQNGPFIGRSFYFELIKKLGAGQ